ncbi:MAG: ComF family protein [Aquificota bacterium]|nr:MAG: ComF family protein [Aquificota bacterium]
MADSHPIRIKGNWDIGYALDFHIISSDFMGYNELDHPIFETQRSKLGELLYRFKYNSDKTVLDEILRITLSFNKFRNIDVIIPVPPSKRSRSFQPVIEIAESLGKACNIPVLPKAVQKIKSTPELKNVLTFEERSKILENAFKITNTSIRNKRILLFDDIYRSGATLNAVANVLYKKGNVSKVKVLVLTKTKRR